MTAESSLSCTEDDVGLAVSSPGQPGVSFQTVLDALPAHAAVLNEEGVIIAVNESWRRFASDNGGDERRCHLGANYLSVCQIPAGSPDHLLGIDVARGIQAVLRGEQPSFSFEYPCHSPGEERWFLMKVVALGGGRSGVIATHENVTDLVRARQAANQTVARLQREADAVAAIASSHELAVGAVEELAAALTTLASTTVDVERAGFWLFDEPARKLVSMDTYVAATDSHSSGAVLEEDAFRAEFAALKASKFVDAHDALTDPRTSGYAEGYLKPNGITSMLDAVIRCGGRILGVLCLEHVGKARRWESDEISFACQLADQMALAISNRERREAEEARANLEAQNRQLQKSESLGRMAGAIAHHYNNKLLAVRLNLELCQADLARTRAGEEVLRCATAAMESTRELVELGRSLLLYLSQVRMDRSPLDLASVCRGLLPMLQATVPPAIHLSVDLPTSGPVIRGDAKLLEAALVHLVNNAREAMSSDGGVIELALRTVTAQEIQSQNRFPIDFRPQSTTYGCLVVQDTGCGIDGNNIQNLFDPFFSSKFPGRGLGLPVVLGIIREHRGAITLESIPALGARFKVYLPTVEPQRLDPPPAGSRLPSPQTPGHTAGS